MPPTSFPDNSLAFISLLVLSSCGPEVTPEEAEEKARLRQNATSSVTVGGNLDSREDVPLLPWSIEDPGGTANLSAAFDIRDTVGRGRPLLLYFRKEGTGEYSFHAVVSGRDVDTSGDARHVEVGAGSLRFATDGGLVAASGTDSLSLDFLDTEETQEIELDFGSERADGGSGRDGFTQYALASSISFKGQGRSAR